MKPKVLRTEKDYQAALERVGALMDTAAGTPEGEDLDLWVTLVQLYEDKTHPIPLPDPIAAVKFRMEQTGLTRKDMVPYLGSLSKVSEVLSGKRPLSLPMMRRLHEGLGIPAASLLSKPGAVLPAADPETQWGRFPVVEMCRRGWLASHRSPQVTRQHAEALMHAFIAPFDEALGLPMCARQQVRDGRQMDAYALSAWKIRIMHLATEQSVAPYVPGTVTQDSIREVVRLSFFADGPRLAREYLAKSGIHLVIERHLSKTYLDGAALLTTDGHPLVALTLRYDRLDNFWFTLAHELAHVALHLDEEDQSFFDDLEAKGSSELEREADRLAAEALIPLAAWKSARLGPASSAEQIKAFAAEQRISPSIPAGRIRHESNNHTVFWQLLGNHSVRVLFENPE